MAASAYRQAGADDGGYGAVGDWRADEGILMVAQRNFAGTPFRQIAKSACMGARSRSHMESVSAGRCWLTLA